MALVRDISIDEVPADARDVYRRYTEEYGPFLNQVRVFAHRPPALRHIMGMLLENAEHPIISKRYIEIALVVVSRLSECEYCVTHHLPRLIKQGLLRQTVEHILDPNPGLDPVELLVRDWAIIVIKDPRRASVSPVFQGLRQHFSEEQIVELTLRITLCEFFNKFNDALQIEIEPDAIEEMLSLDKVS
jgi:AhpD family alkylhydroperoxidase